ncbi:RNA-directed DNA polymerase, eukaryota [Tanacetum coccineum]
MVKCCNSLYIVLGDFNEVKSDNERLGTNFCIRGAKLFNEFIEKSKLIDLPMGGRKFTRMNKYDTKLSKIDRILLSDHYPLVLKTHSTDYGPIPFKFFNSWLLNGDFHNVVTHGWSTTDSAHFLLSQLNSPDHPAINLKRKLQHLKSQIRAWRKGELTKNEHLIDSLKQKINVLEEKAENGSLDDQDMADRLSHLKTLEDLEHLKNLDLKQKAKVNWAIEGDENSKFFHGIINNKFSRSRINGISIHGSWVTDPILVTSHIFNFHKCKFQNNVTNRPRFTSNMFKKLTSLEVTLLDAPFTNVEIKEAVWNCGGEKAPGPDGFTFKFKNFYGDTVGNDFIDMVKHFERNGSIPKGCNSSFIALVPKIQDPLHLNDFRSISLIGCQYKVIAKVLANRLLKVINSIVSEVQTAYIQGRQIIDGPLIVNEILAWATKKKRTPLHLKS